MIVIQDILYARYQAPDLDVMEQFLSAFGMTRTARTDRSLFMRGEGSAPYLHVTDLGPEARSNSFGLLARSTDDLEKLADHLGLATAANDEPAGGRILRFTDPSGFDVEVLADVQMRSSAPPRPQPPFNLANERSRLGQTKRSARGPAHVHRLGHVLLRCTQMPKSLEFYTGTLGFRISDSGYVNTPDNVTGHFLRCGLGETYTDHHTLGLFQRPESKIDHSGFEVLDLDDLMVGDDFLKGGEHRHLWGVGRHVEGSQIFNYWRDPYGNKIEHWTDGDQVNDSYEGHLTRLSPEGLSQWGPKLPPDFYQ
jgi:catechol 2,3-dioxygenase-like lactoylglutathione lyase family enzyme